MAWFFWFFFVSGFCSVLCELIWLRLSMAQFGVTTALTSIVLSVFMAGLGVGSWIAGTMLRRCRDRITFPPLRLYAALELMIGLSALVVPAELVWGASPARRAGGSGGRVFGHLLFDLGILAVCDHDPVVCLHGRHHPSSHVCDPSASARRRWPLVQFPLSCECVGRDAWFVPAAPAHRALRFS
jgi:hypothetical protein